MTFVGAHLVTFPGTDLSFSPRQKQMAKVAAKVQRDRGVMEAGNNKQTPQNTVEEEKVAYPYPIIYRVLYIPGGYQVISTIFGAGVND